MTLTEPVAGIYDYGLAAIRAVRRCHDGTRPYDAWLSSTPEFPESARDAKKRCPMAAFLLGLCEGGHIGGINGSADYVWAGNVAMRNSLAEKPYGKHSKEWARKALDELAKDSELARLVETNTEEARGQARSELMRRVGYTDQVEYKNSQIDVVMAIWIIKAFVLQSEGAAALAKS